MTSRPDSLRQLEREVGVLIRRIKRVIGERAHAVHEDLQPASYLMLSWLADEGFRHGFTTKAAQQGERGLGLALTRQTCLRRAGSISVDGSVFTARLPIGALL